MIQTLRSHLIESIRLRLRADVPVGIYLSGGIDSSAIAGIVTHLVKQEGVGMGSLGVEERVRCFSIGFDEGSGMDESGECDRDPIETPSHREWSPLAEGPSYHLLVPDTFLLLSVPPKIVRSSLLLPS
jgi:hypothetical protein